MAHDVRIDQSLAARDPPHAIAKFFDVGDPALQEPAAPFRAFVYVPCDAGGLNDLAGLPGPAGGLVAYRSTR